MLCNCDNFCKVHLLLNLCGMLREKIQILRTCSTWRKTCEADHRRRSRGKKGERKASDILDGEFERME